MFTQIKMNEFSKNPKVLKILRVKQRIRVQSIFYIHAQSQ